MIENVESRINLRGFSGMGCNTVKPIYYIQQRPMLACAHHPNVIIKQDNRRIIVTRNELLQTCFCLSSSFVTSVKSVDGWIVTQVFPEKIPKITSWCCVYPVFNVYIYCQKELKEYTKVLAIAYQGNHPFLNVSCYNLLLNSVLMLR